MCVCGSSFQDPTAPVEVLVACGERWVGLSSDSMVNWCPVGFFSGQERGGGVCGEETQTDSVSQRQKPHQTHTRLSLSLLMRPKQYGGTHMLENNLLFLSPSYTSPVIPHREAKFTPSHPSQTPVVIGSGYEAPVPTGKINK